MALDPNNGVSRLNSIVTGALPGGGRPPAQRPNGGGGSSDDGYRDAFTKLTTETLMLVGELEQEKLQLASDLRIASEELGRVKASAAESGEKVTELMATLGTEQQEHLAVVTKVQNDLATANTDLAAATKKSEEVETEVEKLKTDLAAALKRAEDAEAEVVRLKAESEQGGAAKLGLKPGDEKPKGDPESPKEELSLKDLKEKTKELTPEEEQRKEDLALLAKNDELQLKFNKEGGRINKQNYDQFWAKYGDRVTRLQSEALAAVGGA